MPRHFLRTLLVFAFLAAPPVHAQSDLPLADDAQPERLVAHVRRLLQALDDLKAPLAPDTTRAVRAVLDSRSAKPDETALELQRLLDPHCLIGVHINPESRVKAARGPVAARLTRDTPAALIVKVHNQAGVTHPLNVGGPEAGGWLTATTRTERPRDRRLSGDVVEYVLLQLTARTAGRREATLKFDVGQGTQDLGFRAEVPVLFTVAP